MNWIWNRLNWPQSRWPWNRMSYSADYLEHSCSQKEQTDHVVLYPKNSLFPQQMMWNCKGLQTRRQSNITLHFNFSYPTNQRKWNMKSYSILSYSILPNKQNNCTRSQQIKFSTKNNLTIYNTQQPRYHSLVVLTTKLDIFRLSHPFQWWTSNKPAICSELLSIQSWENFMAHKPSALQPWLAIWQTNWISSTRYALADRTVKQAKKSNCKILTNGRWQSHSLLQPCGFRWQSLL